MAVVMRFVDVPKDEVEDVVEDVAEVAAVHSSKSQAWCGQSQFLTLLSMDGKEIPQLLVPVFEQLCRRLQSTGFACFTRLT